ncbi:MAG: S9 family peptidase, partial [Myxococcota bacterium]
MRRLAPVLLAASLAHADDGTDPHQWLEAVEDEAALDWVRERNAETTDALTADPAFASRKAKLLSIYDSNERIAYPSQMGGSWYNFWQDAEHPKGLWRRTSEASYRAGNPEWEIVLDIDALGKKEGENWVYKGSSCLYPEYRRCLIELSRGGADATVTREFDIQTKEFVEGGFYLPEAQRTTSWIDQHPIYVMTDFGDGPFTVSGDPPVTTPWTLA